MAITLDGTNGITTPDLTSSDITVTDIIDASGIYLGGTGAANKLDDYEEGTWTPTNADDATGVIAANAYGRYVKIGRQVTVQCVFQVATNFSDHRIGGLPFAPENATTIVSSIHATGRCFYSSSYINTRISDGSLLVSFENDTGGDINPSTSNDPFRFNLTYFTT